ncbi:amidohydrolase family protein [Undibacterium piscinae]|uniref:Amidohydrolase family protein n=1 Tax=Undibacterium piscinae TaxID=2495591 RepID=A0A6M4ABY4_9BURK|nr:amidohydrolase family protein [Undibacterium piscinae]
MSAYRLGYCSRSTARKSSTLPRRFHINHILYYGDALSASLIGPQMAQQVLPVKRAFELDMHPTLHADSPMFPPNAYSLMKTAITRKTSSGAHLNLEQAITIEQALRAMTINGAYQLGVADKTGSLEVGKWADLQIIKQNPYRTPTDALDRIELLAFIWLVLFASLRK